MQKSHRRGCRGVISMMAVQIVMLVFLLMVAGIRIGLFALQRQEHQNQADAMTIAAGLIAQNDGVSAVCNHEALSVLARENRQISDSNNTESLTLCPQPERVADPDGTAHLGFRIAASDEVNHSYSQVLPFEDENRRIGATGMAQIVEHSFDEVERHYPKLVMVLDYSGSMRANFEGRRSRLDVLKNSINNLLDLQLRVEYGAVLFSTDVVDTVAIDQDDRQQDIRNTVGRYNPLNLTNYPAGLRYAMNLLLQTNDTGWYILFVTDGQPEWNSCPYNSSCAVNQSLEIANTIRANGITIYTLFIGENRAAEDLLIRMGGSESDPGNPDYAFAARNAGQLEEAFRRIISTILCTIGPLEPAPPAGSTTNDVHVYLDDHGQEIELQPVASFEYANSYAYQYNAAENKISLSEAACDQVIDNGATIQVRYGPLQLRE